MTRRKNARGGEHCFDCGVNTLETNEYYMVTDSCWARAKMKARDGMLCVGCLERRLGRKLTPRNFIDCPLNWRNVCLPDYASPRLLSRLLGGRNSKWRKGALELIDAALHGETGPLQSKVLVNVGVAGSSSL